MKKIFIIAVFAQLMFLQNAFGGTVDEFTLKNGIRVIFDKTDGPQVVSMRVFTPVSATSEDRNLAGLSYFTSRLMTKSTLNRSNEVLANDIDNIGADISPDVDYDYASIALSVLAQYFDKGVEILSDVIMNPAFDAKELEFEKQDAIAGLNSRKDSIGAVASDKFTKLFYGNLAYSVPVTGSVESIKRITVDDMRKWHQYSYNASNMIIVVAGNIDKKIVKDSLNRHFANIASGEKFVRPVLKAQEPSESVSRIKGKFNQAYIYMGFPAPTVHDKDFVTLKAAGAVLGGKMSSRLFVELREKMGLAYDVNVVYPSRIGDSFFAIYIGLDKKNIDLTLKRINEILKDFSENEVGAQELKDTKTYVSGIYALDRQTVGKLSYYYGLREIWGMGYEYDKQYIEDFNKVSAKEIKDVADSVFKQKAITVIIDPAASKK